MKICANLSHRCVNLWAGCARLKKKAEEKQESGPKGTNHGSGGHSVPTKNPQQDPRRAARRQKCLPSSLAAVLWRKLAEHLAAVPGLHRCHLPLSASQTQRSPKHWSIDGTECQAQSCTTIESLNWWNWKGPLKAIWCQPCTAQGHPQLQQCSQPIPWPRLSAGMGHHHLSGQPVPLPHCLWCKNFFLTSSLNLPSFYFGTFGVSGGENEKSWRLMADTSTESPRPNAHFTAFFQSFSNSSRISLRNQQSTLKCNPVISWHKCLTSDEWWPGAFLHIEINYFKSSTVTTNQERHWARSKAAPKSPLTLQGSLPAPSEGTQGGYWSAAEWKTEHVFWPACHKHSHFICAVCELRAWRRAQSHLT